MQTGIQSKGGKLARTLFSASLLAAAGIVAADELSLLSDLTANSQDPAIHSTSALTAAVWAGSFEGTAVLVLALRDAGGPWRQPAIIDALEKGECREPVLRIADSHPTVAWIRSEGSTQTLCFRGPDGATETISRSRVRMETPALMVADGERPLIAWTEGGAGRFAVLTARRESEGQWVVTPVSTALDSYDLLPTLSQGGAQTLHWYSLGDDDFLLRTATLKGGEWVQRPSHASLPALPARYLPIFSPGSGGVPDAAIWIEPLADGALLWAYGGVDATLSPVAPAELVLQSDPDFVNTAAGIYAVWREQKAGVNELRVRTPWDVQSIPGTEAIVQPCLTVTDEGLDILAISDEALGGDGAVYAYRTTF